MNTYKITPRVENAGSLNRASLLKAFSDALTNIRRPVQEIVDQSSGRVDYDGSNFGKSDRPGNFAAFMRVTVPEHTVNALRDVKGVETVKIDHAFDMDS